MSTSIPYTVQASTPGGGGGEDAQASESQGFSINQFFGRGILRPFERDQKNDFANAEGAALLASNCGQVLQTRKGEVRWRTEFGSRLNLLRHRNQTMPVFDELAKVYATEALSRWEKRVRVTSVERLGTRVPSSTTATFRVIFDIVDKSGRTVLADQEAVVPLSL